jgi:hypothetical protein
MTTFKLLLITLKPVSPTLLPTLAPLLRRGFTYNPLLERGKGVCSPLRGDLNGCVREIIKKDEGED